MRRTASSVLRDLEIRVARLEKSANNSEINGVALDLIKKYRKSLGRVLAKAGIEMKPPHPRAGNIFFYVDGMQGVLEVSESYEKENELIVEHKVASGKSLGTWTIDVRNFVSANTDAPSTYDLKDWSLDQNAFADLILG